MARADAEALRKQGAELEQTRQDTEKRMEEMRKELASVAEARDAAGARVAEVVLAVF